MTEQLQDWAEQLAVFDTETTGISVKSSRIVSATLALLDGSGAVTKRHDWLIDPGVEIPEMATRVHGITTEMARLNGMVPAEAIRQIVAHINTYIDSGIGLVIYNAPYDLSLLAHEAKRHSVDFAWDRVSPIFDPLVIDKQLDRYRKGNRKLETVAAHYGVELLNAHDAGEDAIAAGRIMQRIAARYVSSLPETGQQLHSAQVEWARQQAESFQEYMRKNKDPFFKANGSWPATA